MENWESKGGGEGEGRWICQTSSGNDGEGDGSGGGNNGVEVEKCELMIGEEQGEVLREVQIWHDGSDPGGVCGRG
jgi:hypothetical protein